MKRWKKLSTTLAVASLLTVNFPMLTTNAQVAPNAPVELSVDILLQVQANQPKRQANASYEIVRTETGEVVYQHRSDQDVQGSLALAPGNYRLRLYDGQAFQRDGKALVAQKVEQTIAKRNEQEQATNKQMKELDNKGTIQKTESGEIYYEVPFTVEAGPDLETADHTKMEAKLAVYLSDALNQAEQGTPASSASTQTDPTQAVGTVQFTIKDEKGQAVPNAVIQFGEQRYTSDNNGEIRLEQLTEADYPYQVVALPEGYTGELSETVHVKAGQESRIDLTVNTVATTHSLTIKVVNEGQEPLSQVGVEVNGQVLTTDAQGQVTVPNLAAGPLVYRIISAPEGYEVAQTATVEMGQADASTTVTLASKPTVDKTALQAELDKAATVQVADTTNKTEASVAAYTAAKTAFETAKATAQQVQAASDATAEQVAQATTDLQTKLAQLNDATTQLADKPAPTVDKTALQAELDKAATVQVADTTNKTEASVAAYTAAKTAFETAKATAQQVQSASDASAEQVAQATSDLQAKLAQLNDATTQLADKPAPTVDKTALQAELDKAATVQVVDTTNKTEASVAVYTAAKTAFETAKATAQQVQAASDATAEQVAQATTDLQTKLAQLNDATTQLADKPVAKASVSLKAVDEQQQAVANAQVYFGGLKGTTDTNGVVTFSELDPGDYHYGIQVAPDGYQVKSSEQVVTVAAGANLTQTLHLVKQVQTAQLRVHVVNVKGEPISNVSVQVGNQTVQTDQAGNVAFSDLAPGNYTYQVTAVPKGYQANDAKIQVTLAKGQSLQRTIQLTEAVATASSESSAVAESVVATKSTAVERKKGLPRTGELVMNWLVPTGLVLMALAGAVIYRRKQAIPVEQDEQSEQ